MRFWDKVVMVAEKKSLLNRDSSANSGDLLRGGFVLGSYRAALKRFLTGIISD
ncbi:hypothetical protein [Leptospira santarosai]|uniref:hypothetical protein n=1 Tax=Leptospira santarosai TaxID=28183 RepID=UPI0018AD1DC9|nr:hypothetical protein [Leptospira santarosai]MDI7210563.1 hypothetical protein [Leptospira santarosai]